MMCGIHDTATRMRAMGPHFQHHQEAMQRDVMETLGEYSGIVHTLPMLVRRHEESMETYNYSKQKDSVSRGEGGGGGEGAIL